MLSRLQLRIGERNWPLKRPLSKKNGSRRLRIISARYASKHAVKDHRRLRTTCASRQRLSLDVVETSA